MLQTLRSSRTLSQAPVSAWRQVALGADAFERAQHRFGSALAAEQYPAGYRRDLKGIFEQRAISKMLDELPAGGHILDCPCGTGRVARLLMARDFRVTAADCSPHMVSACRNNMQSVCGAPGAHSYDVEDVAALSYAARSFDGVVCNRLMHHYDRSEERVRVLRELARVSRGPVIVSFTSAASVSGWRKLARKALSGAKAGPNLIPVRQMAAEFGAAGLRVTRTHAVIWGFSRMWYMAGEPA